MRSIFLGLMLFCSITSECIGFFQSKGIEDALKLNDLGYFEKRGLNILAFSNWYDGNFSDSKISGIEIIHHGVRTATNGDVRLSPTPGQWDPIPKLVDRKIDKENNTVEAFLSYPEYNFDYSVKAESRNGGIFHSGRHCSGSFDHKTRLSRE